MGKLLIGTLSIAVLVLATACGDDDDNEEVSVCDQKAAVEESVRALADLDVIASGTDGLSAAVEAVREDLSGLREAVSEETAPEVEALETAVADARDTLSDINDDSTLSERIGAVEEALTDIATAAADLTTALDEDC